MKTVAKLLFIISFFPRVLTAQELAKGIKFEQNTTWEKIKSQAKDENKYIFVDCYATWCGPCKKMDKEVYINDTVGSLVNARFISVKVQMDSLATDNDEIKDWYSTAHLLQQENRVLELPTYLFYSPDGKLVHKSKGAKKVKEFINLINVSTDTASQYYTLLSKYQQGNKSKEVICNLLPAALKMGEQAIAYQAADLFISMLDKPYTKDNLILIKSVLVSSKSKAFEIFLSNPEKVNSELDDKHIAEYTLTAVLSKEMREKYLDEKGKTAQWDKIQHELDQIVPSIADEIVMKMKIDYSIINKKWEVFGQNLLAFYDKYYLDLNHNDYFYMNNALWMVFMNCYNKTILMNAAVWALKILNRFGPNTEDPTVMDTYANLMYKAGNISEGIAWEEKAMNMTKGKEQKNEFSETMEKMRKGIPTWKSNK